MHLVYKQKSEMLNIENNTFAVVVSQKIQEENDFDLDEIYSEFCQDREEKIQKYHDLVDKEIQIAKERKKLLTELKTEFKDDFVPDLMERCPEYFL